MKLTSDTWSVKKSSAAAGCQKTYRMLRLRAKVCQCEMYMYCKGRCGYIKTFPRITKYGQSTVVLNQRV